MTDATDEEHVPHDYTNDPDGLTRDDVRPIDAMLQAFIAGALGLTQDDSDASFAITLNVSGVIISGTAIPLGRWTRLTLEKIKSNSEAMGEIFTIVTDSMSESSDERIVRRNEAGLPNPFHKFLHLRDVTIFTPGDTLQPDLWRVNLRQVTGWNLGSFTRVTR